MFDKKILKDSRKNDRFSRAGVIIAVLIFLIGAFYFTYQENYFFLLIPIAGFVLSFFLFDLNKVLLLIAFLTPFSIDVVIVGDSKLSILTEPLLIMFSLVFIFKILIGGNYDHRIFKHPVSVVILLFLLWSFVTTITSGDFIISLKQTIARTWFIVPCFFGAAHAYKYPKDFKQFYFAYGLSLLIIIFISTYHLYIGGFSQRFFYMSMRPYYNDHTEYGVVLALFLPVCWMYIIQKSKNNLQKLWVIISFAALLTGLILSFSRAAWISLICAVGMYFLIKTKIKMRWISAGFVITVFLFFSYQYEIIYKMGKNVQNSSTNLMGHVKSISNISTDDSNLERLNRWASAFRMIEEKPILGWGPGMYQNKYAIYQKSYQLTKISTNSGNLGAVHSEYFGPLVESGILGMVLKILIFVLTFSKGIQVYRNSKNKQIGVLALYLTLALFTYYVHGIFNEFLSNDKLSVPFWVFTAVIVALDISYPKKDDDHTDDKTIFLLKT